MILQEPKKNLKKGDLVFVEWFLIYTIAKILKTKRERARNGSKIFKLNFNTGYIQGDLFNETWLTKVTPGFKYLYEKATKAQKE